MRIPLTAGWNTIGDPFPFTVDLERVPGGYQGQTSPERGSDARWISGTLYTYEPGAGYTWVMRPLVQLKPWGRLLGQGEGQLLAAGAAGPVWRDWPGREAL